jgi:hypothetical protein
VSTAVLLLGLIWPFSAAAGIEVLRSDATRIELRYTIEEHRIETIACEAGSCSRVLLTGGTAYGKPSQPDLPVRRFLIEIPAETIPVLTADVRQEKRIKVAPPLPFRTLRKIGSGNGSQKLLESHRLSLATYAAAHSPFPAELALVQVLGLARHRRVAVVEIAPFQYGHAEQELTINLEIDIRIDHSRTPAKGDRAETELLAGRTVTDELDDAIGSLLLTRLPDEVGKSPVRRVPPDARRRIVKQLEPTGGVGIGVREEGIYFVSFESIAASGGPISAPDNLHLTTDSGEVAIRITGTEDGSLDPGDGIIFYQPAWRSPYANIRYYHLYAGDTPGERMQTRQMPRVGEVQQLTSYPAVERFELDLVYWPDLPDDEPWSTDPFSGNPLNHWFWISVAAPDGDVLTFNLTHPDTTAIPATIRVWVRAKSESSVSPAHHVEIDINSSMRVGDYYWDGRDPECLSGEVSADILQHGVNSLRFWLTGDTGAELDLVLLDRIQVDYQRRFRADSDRISFRIDDRSDGLGTAAEIEGFTSSDLVLLDVTDPMSPVWYDSLPVAQDQTGTEATLSFQEQAGVTGSFMAVSREGLHDPATIRPWTEVDLSDSADGADLLIVVAENLMSFIGPGSSRVTVVRASDVFDSFSHGTPSPHAIRDFIRHVWLYWPPPAPRQVYLVGDATSDYRGQLSQAPEHPLPSFLVQTSPNGDTASDYPFACVAGNDLIPDLVVSRLPASNPSQLQAYTQQLVDLSPALPVGQTSTLLVADDGFEYGAERLITDTFPDSHRVDRLYFDGIEPVEQFRSRLFEQLEAGHTFVVYIGHGGKSIWAHEHLLRYQDLMEEPFARRFGVFLGLTCLNGYFDFPDSSEILAEGWLFAPTGGGAAAVAPSRLLSGRAGEILNGYLLRHLLGGRELGTAVMLAKIETLVNEPGELSAVLQNNLLGDAALQMVDEE